MSSRESIKTMTMADEMDALDSGVEALGGESPMLASEVLAYLQSHPNFSATTRILWRNCPCPRRKMAM